MAERKAFRRGIARLRRGPAGFFDAFCSLSPDAVRGPAVFPSIQEDKER